MRKKLLALFAGAKIALTGTPIPLTLARTINERSRAHDVDFLRRILHV